MAAMRTGFRLLLALAGLCVMWGSAFPAWAQAEQDVADESVDAAESDCRGECPDDDEDGDCPPGCDACFCCPAASSPAVGPAVFAGAFWTSRATAGQPLDAGEAEEGVLSRVFHPPRAIVG